MPEDLMGLAELGEFLGVSRQRADQLARIVGFPEPVVTLAGGRIWQRRDVERWARLTGRAAPVEFQGEWEPLPTEVLDRFRQGSPRLAAALEIGPAAVAVYNEGRDRLFAISVLLVRAGFDGPMTEPEVRAALSKKEQRGLDELLGGRTLAEVLEGNRPESPAW